MAEITLYVVLAVGAVFAGLVFIYLAAKAAAVAWFKEKRRYLDGLWK